MPDRPPDPAFAAQVAALRGPEVPLVWSYLVTVFGDLAPAGEALPGVTLGRITAPVGIRAEALRVALHRLRKDGWIDSRRLGRTSHYALTRHGQAETARAAPRIYARDSRAGRISLVLIDPGRPAPALDPRAVWLGPQVALVGQPPPASAGLWVLDTNDLPGWARDRVCPPDLARQVADLDDRLATLGAACDPAALSPLQRVVLRVLVVHAWRRVVLRLPDLPDPAFPPGWRGAACRGRVASVLDRLPRVAPEALAASSDTARD